LSDRILSYEIPEEYEGHKIHEFLTSKGYSVKLQTELKKNEECVKLNGTPAFLNRVLTGGDTLNICIKQTCSSEKIPPVNIDIDIIYEDEDIVVVNKPAHMPIHPSMNNYENTLGNALAYRYLKEGDKFVYRCINRLDRDTTGLTVIARNMLSACVLYDQMVSRQIKRTYFAVCEGVFESRMGTINMPLCRKPDSAIERMVDYKNGEEAITHYEVMGTDGRLSLVKLWLDTGRTHQIRVHMKAAGHPLIGDFLYNPDNKDMDRQALHAGELRLIHPVNGNRLDFLAPLPGDMKKTVAGFFS